MHEGKKGTIGLIHGYMHRGAHWAPFQHELEERGYDTIATDLPTYDTEATYADYARAMAEALQPAIERGEQIDLMPHSMGSQVVPDLAKILGTDAIRSIIDISGSWGNASDRHINELMIRLIPGIPRQRNSEGYRDATLQLEGGLTLLNPAKIRELLFGDCDAETFVWALELMRPQGKPKDEPPLWAQRIPGIPRYYVLPDDDQIRNAEWAHGAARQIGATVVGISGGHSPAISRPAELADLTDGILTRLSNQENTRPVSMERLIAEQNRLGY